MFHFIAANAGTIVVTLILIAIVALIIRSRFRERKNGQCSCGCYAKAAAEHVISCSDRSSGTAFRRIPDGGCTQAAKAR